MAQEIERKFLVKNDSYKKESVSRTRITQGYISSIPERTVRVRIRGNKGFLTIKGKANDTGVSRYEWEKEIPFYEAQELLKICESGVIDKTRFIISVDNHLFEVDEFYGDNEGLVVAEVELQSEDEKYEKPHWLGVEVSGVNKYYNSQLVKAPFKNWE